MSSKMNFIWRPVFSLYFFDSVVTNSVLRGISKHRDGKPGQQLVISTLDVYQHLPFSNMTRKSSCLGERVIYRDVRKLRDVKRLRDVRKPAGLSSPWQSSPAPPSWTPWAPADPCLALSLSSPDPRGRQPSTSGSRLSFVPDEKIDVN